MSFFCFLSELSFQYFGILFFVDEVLMVNFSFVVGQVVWELVFVLSFIGIYGSDSFRGVGGEDEEEVQGRSKYLVIESCVLVFLGLQRGSCM